MCTQSSSGSSIHNLAAVHAYGLSDSSNRDASLTRSFGGLLALLLALSVAPAATAAALGSRNRVLIVALENAAEEIGDAVHRACSIY